MRSKFFFTASMVGMLSGVALGAMDGAEVDYGRDWSPYVTLRGGWLFSGKTKYNYHWVGHDTAVPPVPDGEKSVGSSKNFGSAWSGSGEVGVLFFEERVSVGLELGYFSGTGKTAFGSEEDTLDNWNSAYNFTGALYLSGFGGYCRTEGKYKNLFAAVNVTLKKDVNERTFLYSGIGAGMARSDFGSIDYRYREYPQNDLHPGRINFKAKWRFLGQAFGGLGWYLNDNWSLTVGYRLRYLAGDGRASGTFAHNRVKWDWKVKQDLIHAVEVGVMYQF